jgi:hypothetical protein
MLIAKILPTKAFALLSAHPKAGKSTLAMTICHSVAGPRGHNSREGGQTLAVFAGPRMAEGW